uniref:Uncharacterized protein n=1 Tax=Meloidogyne incognita TaxID=6306 RepID=A0A914KUP9_MELIC
MLIIIQIETSIGQSNYITFVLENKQKSWWSKNSTNTIVVSVESTAEIEGLKRSQKWTLYPKPRNSSEFGNFYDFNKVHQFNFGQYKPVGNSLYLDIKTINAHTKDDESVANIPDTKKKYFASISIFEEEIELTLEQFYGSEEIELDLIGKSCKSTFMQKLSSTPKKLLRKMSSNKLLTKSGDEVSAIEKHIKNSKNSKLEVNIYMKAKCGMCSSGSKEVFDKIVYLTDGYYRCQDCFKEFYHERNTSRVYTDVMIELPSVSRKIRNPILQNGNGLGFTYIFDFARQKQNIKINLNFVQLVNPNNLHNESTSSSHVPKYGFQTPTHPTNVFTNFQNLNLGGESSGNGGNETERPNYAAMHGGQGTQLNFDEASNSTGSSTNKQSSRRPPKSHNRSPPTDHEKAQQIPMQKGAQTQPKLKTTRSMPVEREQEHGSNNHGISYGVHPRVSTPKVSNDPKYPYIPYIPYIPMTGNLILIKFFN